MAQIKPLPADLQKVAEVELGEVPSRISSDLEAFKTWIKQQPHLKARLDDEFLIQYLRGCKYSLEKAKEKIDNFYTMKSKVPEVFNVTDVTNVRFREVFNLKTSLVLPTPLNDNGPRIMVLQHHDDLANGKYSVEEYAAVINTIHELLLLDDPYACINGVVYIYNYEGVTASYVLKYSPSLLKNLLDFYEKSIPLRTRKLYYTNVATIFQIISKIVNAFFPEKLKSRLVTCGNTEELQTHIPKKYLPTDFGGENGSLDQIARDFEKKWEKYSDYFKENINYGTNEELRPGKPLDVENMFGLGGSFRKLDVD